MAKGKGKGSLWERDVAKTLTKWLTGVEKPYVWWRAPGSGAMATISAENKELSGDIIPLRPEGAFLTDKYSIECKVGYPNSNIHKHLKGVKNDEIRLFWEQCCGDADRAGKLPMLIYKKKQFNALIGVPHINSELGEIPFIQMSWGNVYDLPRLYLFDMEEFLNTVSPEDLKIL